MFWLWDPISLVVVVAIVALGIVVWRQQQRLRVLEFDLEGLRKAFLAHREKVALSGVQPVAEAASAPPAEAIVLPTQAAADIAVATVSDGVAALPPEPQPAEPAAQAGPWTPADAAPSAPPAESPPPARPARPTIETALGTRWAVWVGGLALALGGIFLVRYSIEA